MLQADNPDVPWLRAITERRNAVWRGLKLAIRGGLLVLFVFVAGFVAFVMSLHRQPPATVPRADGIVVLTGGKDRIGVALRLLAEDHAGRLLISGVNRQTTRRDLMRVSPVGHRLFDCCVDIGYRALDTVGNASETHEWVRNAEFQSIIVVTSSYHMPRSLAELRRVLPDVTLVPYTVVPKSLDIDSWWRDPNTASLLVREYLKFLPAAARFGVAMVAGAPHASRRASADAAGFRTD